MNHLTDLAELIIRRNKIDNEIATLIRRPALTGHIGEYIASQIFGISLVESASTKAIDGHFTGQPLAGHTVNVKYYPKNEGVLDLKLDAAPNYYLVLTGPRTSAASSRGAPRPLVVELVYLFESRALVDALRRRGVLLGQATSVIKDLWDEAEIYPSKGNSALILSDEQRRLLALFATVPREVS